MLWCVLLEVRGSLPGKVFQVVKVCIGRKRRERSEELADLAPERRMPCCVAKQGIADSAPSLLR